MKASPKRSLIALHCLLFFCLTAPIVFSQAWNPFPGGGTYLYSFNQVGSPDTWLHGVRIDSLGTTGGDSVYYLNRVNRYAAQNEVLNGCYGPYNPLPGVILLRQENFFGRHMVIRPNGDYDFVSLAGDTFRLKTQVPASSTWNFATGITATLDSIGAKTVLGQPDSVMYVTLSNNRKIQLSKQHGFVFAPSFLPFVNRFYGWQTVEYDLWGIPSMGLGDTLPGVRGVFDFDVGDEFGFVATTDYPQSNARTTDYTLLTITTKSQLQNGVNYGGMTERVRITDFPFYGIDSTYYSPAWSPVTINYTNYPYLTRLPYESFPGPQFEPVQIGVRLNSNFNGRVEYLFDEILYYEPCIPALDRFEDESVQRYGAGLGRTFREYTSINYLETERLYCYAKIADSKLPCLNLSTLIAVEESLADDPSLQAGPVPTTDVLRVAIENYHQFGPSKLFVFDLRGREVLHREVDQGETSLELNVSSLESGMYLLKLQDEAGLVDLKKFVIQR